jgi:hypothetical protein
MVQFRFKIQGTIFAGDEEDAEVFLKDALIDTEPKNTVGDLKVLCIEEIEEDVRSCRTEQSVYYL